ncbi:hypothetical protein DASC09_029880 [Saccharomycopsis crataegensis]|uniref:Uncharacterized protein n=1 Tax=Saccharomycopsis crataegensis TaxID=43959 RepID=A0AAV5QLK0_9ASCO|nr:hypothetical protein DASC09_029880 [Saccharomycopsis crataegensis]
MNLWRLTLVACTVVVHGLYIPRLQSQMPGDEIQPTSVHIQRLDNNHHHGGNAYDDNNNNINNFEPGSMINFAKRTTDLSYNVYLTKDINYLRRANNMLWSSVNQRLGFVQVTGIEESQNKGDNNNNSNNGVVAQEKNIVDTSPCSVYDYDLSTTSSNSNITRYYKYSGKLDTKTIEELQNSPDVACMSKEEEEEE